jgi:hypothetical protein
MLSADSRAGAWLAIPGLIFTVSYALKNQIMQSEDSLKDERQVILNHGRQVVARLPPVKNYQ